AGERVVAEPDAPELPERLGPDAFLLGAPEAQQAAPQARARARVRAQRHVLEEAQARAQVQVLERARQPEAGDLVRVPARDVAAGEAHAAGVGPQPARDQGERPGRAGPARPAEAEEH